MGMLDGKVAAITDSGSGMGREIALLMAREGARVVVQDSGSGGREGGGVGCAGEGVVEKIREGGGEAVAYSESVASWDGSQSLIQTALDHFGRIDVLVNHVNHLEVLQGPIVVDISREAWESVARAHLKTPFLCTRAALPHMRKQRQGRLVYFVSAEALIGSIGHTHHGALQMAVAGLSRNAAIEMERYHVTCNCIVPCGRGSEGTYANVAPLAVFLASDAAERLSGQIFGVRDKEVLLFTQPRIERSMHDSRGWTVERLCGRFEPAMRPHFTPLEPSESYFSWDPTL